MYERSDSSPIVIVGRKSLQELYVSQGWRCLGLPHGVQGRLTQRSQSLPSAVLFEAAWIGKRPVGGQSRQVVIDALQRRNCLAAQETRALQLWHQQICICERGED